jgi:ketosteroid isomerase-like protein
MSLGTAPAAVRRFVEAAAARDFAAIGECFTDDATVSDEQHTHRGRTEIRQWQEASRQKWEYTLTVNPGRARGSEGYVVEGHLSGNFPGGEADVTSNFTLRDALISRLVIS